MIDDALDDSDDDEHTLYLNDTSPGDLVVIELDGDVRWVEVGGHVGNLKASASKKKRSAVGKSERVFVSDYDPDRHFVDTSTWRTIAGDTIVLGIHESQYHRREMRILRRWRVGGEDGTVEDPMMKRKTGVF